MQEQAENGVVEFQRKVKFPNPPAGNFVPFVILTIYFFIRQNHQRLGNPGSRTTTREKSYWSESFRPRDHACLEARLSASVPARSRKRSASALHMVFLFPVSRAYPLLASA